MVHSKNSIYVSYDYLKGDINVYVCNLIIVFEHTKLEHTPRPINDINRTVLYYINVAQVLYYYKRADCP